jgi:hypothetical protein
MTPTQPQTFPLSRALDMAFRSLFENAGYALRICWAWIVIMTSARVASDIAKTHLLSDAQGQPLLGFDLTFFIGWFLFIPLASIAVAWHRLLLFGERDSASIYLRVDRMVWSYFGLAIVLYLTALAPVFTVGGISKLMTLMWGLPDVSAADGAARPGLLVAPNARSIIAGMQVIAFLVFLALSARLSVVLPGKALGMRGLTIKRAWDVTRGHTWGLTMGFVACIVPFLILTALLRRSGFNFSLEDGALLHIADWFIIETMGAVLGLIELAYLTFCFRFFFPETDEERSVDQGARAQS